MINAKDIVQCGEAPDVYIIVEIDDNYAYIANIETGEELWRPNSLLIRVNKLQATRIIKQKIVSLNKQLKNCTAALTRLNR